MVALWLADNKILNYRITALSININYVKRFSNSNNTRYP